MAIFAHVVVGTNDLDRSTQFYNAALGALGIGNIGAWGEQAILYGIDAPEFEITKPANGQPATHANGGTVGFSASSRNSVREFHAAGLANGGSDEGAPGPRKSGPNAYGAYSRDPNGNKLCAFCFAEDGDST